MPQQASIATPGNLNSSTGSSHYLTPNPSPPLYVMLAKISARRFAALVVFHKTSYKFAQSPSSPHVTNVSFSLTSSRQRYKSRSKDIDYFTHQRKAGEEDSLSQEFLRITWPLGMLRVFFSKRVKRSQMRMLGGDPLNFHFTLVMWFHTWILDPT